MARAGYHPDYVFAMHHLLRINTGEQSKFQAFFADHPRWETRDQRDDRAYVDALAEYERLWPDPATSPGGVQPAVAFLGNVHGTENKSAGTGDLSLPISCRNIAGPLTLLVHLSKDGHPLESAIANYRDQAGNFAVLAHVSCYDGSHNSPTVVHIPASLISDRDRKLKAQVDLFGPGDQLLERTKLVDVHFPKPDKKNSQTQTAVWIDSGSSPVRQDFPVSAMAASPSHEVTGVPAIQPKASIAVQSMADPVNQARPKVPNPALALGLVTATSQEKGADIVEVVPDGAAETAGLQVGHVIISIDGKRVRDENDLEMALMNRAPGSKVRLGYMFRSNLGWMPGAEKVLTMAKKAN